MEAFFDVLDLLASHFGGRRRGKSRKKNLNFFRAGRESNEGLRNGRTRVFEHLTIVLVGVGVQKTLKPSFGCSQTPKGLHHVISSEAR